MNPRELQVRQEMVRQSRSSVGFMAMHAINTGFGCGLIASLEGWHIALGIAYVLANAYFLLKHLRLLMAI